LLLPVPADPKIKILRSFSLAAITSFVMFMSANYAINTFFTILTIKITDQSNRTLEFCIGVLTWFAIIVVPLWSIIHIVLIFLFLFVIIFTYMQLLSNVS
jgi:hypothetical protein